MGSVKERLQQFLKEERITASEFARKMNLSPTYLASMRKSMPEDKVEKLMEVFPQLNRDWLMYGEGQMYRDDVLQKGIDPYRLDKRIIPLVPMNAAAGSLALYTQGVADNECEKIYSPVKGVDCAIRVKGDSMEPEIHSGTILLLKRINDKMFIPWGSPMVLDTENGFGCKLIFPSTKGEEYIEARSYNPAYPPFPVPLESVYSIYRIVGEIRDAWTF